MATSKIIAGFMLAGTLAACGGEQAPAAVDAAAPNDDSHHAAATEAIPALALGARGDAGASEARTQLVET
jgi:hypothetical protein